MFNCSFSFILLSLIYEKTILSSLILLTAFFTNAQTISVNNPATKQETLKTLTKKGNKVIIEANDGAAITHAVNALKTWAYWIVTEDPAEANFILKFTITNITISDRKGTAQIINPINLEVLKETQPQNSLGSSDFNKKREVVYLLVNQELKPLFK